MKQYRLNKSVECRVPCCGKQIYNKKRRLCCSHYLLWMRHRRLSKLRRNNGSGTITSNNYIVIGVNNVKQYEHILVVEEVLKKPLPRLAEIHHIDGNGLNNKKSNLVVCPDGEYHMMLHRRKRSIDAGYPARYRKCHKCGNYDNPELMYEYKHKGAKHGLRYSHKTKGGECII